MPLRAFRGTFLIAIDEAESDFADESEKGGPVVSLEEVKNFLKDAALIDVDTEEHGNPVGWTSAELIFDAQKPFGIEGLVELTPAEVERLYGQKT